MGPSDSDRLSHGPGAAGGLFAGLAQGWDWLDSAASVWRWGLSAQDALWTAACGRGVIEVRGSERLRAVVEYARSHSRFYANRYRRLPRQGWRLQQLAPVTKRELMAHFDDWVTDAAVTQAGVERFVADPARVGESFLGRYTVWTSSGTTGTPGLFVHDPQALAVYESLTATRFGGSRGAGLLWSGLLQGRRLAMIAATGGHFAGVVSWERARCRNPWLAERVRSFSIMEPLAALVGGLNAYDPGFVASYPSMLALLARERVRGALRIQPKALWCGGESLAASERAAVENAFDCPLIEEYGASECMGIAFGCERGCLHVNADWVVLEAVDADHRPVPPGTASATVLMTNLANRVQPFIRYDLGDSVVVHPQPCSCGSPFPALSVEGRRDDILEFESEAGRTVRILPLALTTVIEEEARVHRFQVIQTGARSVSVRIETGDRSDDEAARKRVRRSVEQYLATQGLGRIRIRTDRKPLEVHPVSGKLRQVLRRTPAADPMP